MGAGTDMDPNCFDDDDGAYHIRRYHTNKIDVQAHQCNTDHPIIISYAT